MFTGDTFIKKSLADLLQCAELEKNLLDKKKSRSTILDYAKSNFFASLFVSKAIGCLIDDPQKILYSEKSESHKTFARYAQFACIYLLDKQDFDFDTHFQDMNPEISSGDEISPNDLKKMYDQLFEKEQQRTEIRKHKIELDSIFNLIKSYPNLIETMEPIIDDLCIKIAGNNARNYKFEFEAMHKYQPSHVLNIKGNKEKEEEDHLANEQNFFADNDEPIPYFDEHINLNEDSAPK